MMKPLKRTIKPSVQLKHMLVKRQEETEMQLKHMTRADERPLLWLVLAFEFLSLMLLAFKNEEIDVFCLRAAVLLPACSYLGYRLMIKKYHVDRVLFILTLFLCGLGVILLRAVFVKSTRSEKQLTLLLTVIPMMLIGMWIPRHICGDSGKLKFVALSFLLLLANFAFSSSSGSHNYIYIGSILQLQTSELLKPVMIIFLASGFTRWGKFGEGVMYACVAAGVCVILMVQRDLGAVFLYFILTLALYAVGTGRYRTTLMTLLLAVAVAAAFVIINRQTGWFGYLNDRIDKFLDPWTVTEEDATVSQIGQGLMSLASGGLFGSGLGLSSARRVAVVESDYIFAAAAEEYGTVFTLCLIGIYVVIMLRGMLAAQNARTHFHALLAFGCSFQLTSQAALIILGNLNIIPLTGVTLPFVSSGGSSLFSASLMIGMILGVSSVNAEDEYDDLMRITKGAPVT